MEKSARIKLLFDRYLQRLCTSGELEELIQLLKDPELEKDLDGRLKEVWDAQQSAGTSPQLDWDQMYSAIVNSGRHTDSILKNATQKENLLLRAGVFILLAAVLTVGTYYLPTKSSSNQASFEKVTGSAGVKQAAKRQVIHLPDGSTVTLNVAARLDYPPVFSKTRRDVYLKGEAFFDIRHKQGQPFYVHVGEVVIKVLGTAFNIKSNEDQRSVEITVSRGKVQVLKDTTSLGTLTASEQMAVSPQIKHAVIKVVDTLAVMNWKPEEIFFSDVTFREALELIAQRFEMKPEFRNTKLADCRVTATFSEDDTMQEMLDVLCGVSRSTYTINGKNIVISGEGCE